MLETRLAKLEARRGENDVARVLSLYTEDELQASIDELEARVAAQFAPLGIDGANYTSIQRLAIIDECERLATEGKTLDIQSLDMAAVSQHYERRMAAIPEDPREQAAHMLEWLTNYRQMHAAAA